MLNKIRFGILYLTVEVRILLREAALSRKKGLKAILPMLMGILLLLSPSAGSAQAPLWPWDFGESFQVTDGTDDNFVPAIASNNNVHLVVLYKKTPLGFKIYGARVGRDGRVFEEDQGGVPICAGKGTLNDQMFPAVSWNGEDFFVVWQDYRSGKRWDIYGARVAAFTKFLTVLDPAGIQISAGRGTYDQARPSLAFDGENHLVVWRGKHSSKISGIYGRFVKCRSGYVLLEDPIIQVSASTKDQASPSVVFNPEDGHYFVVWQDKRGGKFWDIYGARIAPDGTPLDPGDILVSSRSFDQWNPVVSWNGEYFMVVWTASPQGNNWYIYGRLVGPQGNLQNVTDLQLQVDGSSKTFPAILADNDAEYLLVWEEEPEGFSTIAGSVILPGYYIYTGEAKQISESQGANASYPALSKRLNSNDVLVVWQAKSAQGNWQIYSRELSKPGL